MGESKYARYYEEYLRSGYSIRRFSREHDLSYYGLRDYVRSQKDSSLNVTVIKAENSEHNNVVDNKTINIPVTICKNDLKLITNVNNEVELRMILEVLKNV